MKAWKYFEHTIVWAFRELGWKEAKRNFGEQFKKGSGVDLLNTKPFVVQISYGKNPSPINKFKEAQAEAGKGEIPLAIVRRTTEKKRPTTYAVMDWKDLQEIIRKWRLTTKNSSKNSSLS